MWINFYCQFNNRQKDDQNINFNSYTMQDMSVKYQCISCSRLMLLNLIYTALNLKKSINHRNVKDKLLLKSLSWQINHLHKN